VKVKVYYVGYVTVNIELTTVKIPTIITLQHQQHENPSKEFKTQDKTVLDNQTLNRRSDCNMTYCSGTPHKDFCSSKGKFSAWDGQVSNEVGNTFN
jgi:hypothetical protein